VPNTDEYKEIINIPEHYSENTKGDNIILQCDENSDQVRIHHNL